MPSARRKAAVFAALGDETRLRLVTRLSDGEALSIAELTAGTRVSRQAVTKHLIVLARCGLVRSARRGRERCFALDRAPLDEARRQLAEISQRWDEALDRLRAFVETKD